MAPLLPEVLAPDLISIEPDSPVSLSPVANVIFPLCDESPVRTSNEPG